MKTKDNILKALVYEQAAHYNYRKFAQEARKEGLDYVEELFLQLSIEERDHKERLITILKQMGEVEQRGEGEETGWGTYLEKGLDSTERKEQ